MRHTDSCKYGCVCDIGRGTNGLPPQAPKVANSFCTNGRVSTATTEGLGIMLGSITAVRNLRGQDDYGPTG